MHPISWTNIWILLILTYIHHWSRGIKGLDFGDLEGRIWDLIVSVPDHCLSFYFGDLDLISKVTGDIRISNLDQKRFLCTLSCETIDGFLLTSHGYIIWMCYFKEKHYLIQWKKHAFYNWWCHNKRFNACLDTLLTNVMNSAYSLFFLHDIIILNGQKRIVHN